MHGELHDSHKMPCAEVMRRKWRDALQDIAYVLATGYVGLSILLSGFFVRPSQLKVAPLLWLSYISYPRCGNQCTAVSLLWCMKSGQGFALGCM